MGRIRNTPKQLEQKLLNTPFFPLLFISKAVELTAFYAVGEDNFRPLIAMYLLAVVCTLIWLHLDEGLEATD
jgi:hypothetical protein